LCDAVGIIEGEETGEKNEDIYECVEASGGEGWRDRFSCFASRTRRGEIVIDLRYWGSASLSCAGTSAYGGGIF
jgi:hypothetical protein